MTCKYCLLSIKKEDRVSPCKCTGSGALVHKKCLLSWILVKNLATRWQCEVCKGSISYEFRKDTFALGASKIPVDFFKSVARFTVECTHCRKYMICSCKTLGSVCRRILLSMLIFAALSTLFTLLAVLSSGFGLFHQLCACFDAFAVLVEANACALSLEVLYQPKSPFYWYQVAAWSLIIISFHNLNATACGYRIIVDKQAVLLILLGHSTREAARAAYGNYENTRIQAELE